MDMRTIILQVQRLPTLIAASNRLLPVSNAPLTRDHRQSEVLLQSSEPLLCKVDLSLRLTRDESQILRRDVRVGVAKRCCCHVNYVSLIALTRDLRRLDDPPLTGIVATPNSWSKNQQSLQSRVL